MSTEILTTLLGWASVINIGILMVSTIMIFLLGNFATKVHSKMFKMEEADVQKGYFQYLAQYKIVTLVFNVAPYLSLKIMGF
ncbi:DUF6868 family protein [Candidatus Uabimicrobium amorphum]|uniref:DUF6868 domain-containing protein n=2 Tax=Uabimicrobium amorphum TaxID=2596890 RepID=A0A5S9IND1_UABAM|nr:hypothetical protein UABAM_02596 [Candidatus Uabimicrobium amorphum]